MARSSRKKRLGCCSMSFLMKGPYSLFDSSAIQRMNSIKKAGMYWNVVNGDFERDHTCGLYVIPPKKYHVGPTLVVYLDNSSVLQDFLTNKDLYMERMTYQGFPVQDIRFKISHSAVQRGANLRDSGLDWSDAQDTKSLPELSAQQLAEIKEQIKDRPEKIQAMVLKPMIQSYRRQATQEGENE